MYIVLFELFKDKVGPLIVRNCVLCVAFDGGRPVGHGLGDLGAQLPGGVVVHKLGQVVVQIHRGALVFAYLLVQTRYFQALLVLLHTHTQTQTSQYQQS